MPLAIKAELLKIIMHTARLTQEYGKIRGDLEGTVEAYAYELQEYTIEQIDWAFTKSRSERKEFPSICVLENYLTSADCPGITQEQKDWRLKAAGIR